MDGGKAGKEGKGGILKLDKLRTQQSGSGSLDNRDAQELLAQSRERGPPPVSPQPSVDRLSVTWADPELSASSASTKLNLLHMDEAPMSAADRFPPAPAHTEEGSEEEYYSASISAFMTRRESTRRSRKGRGRRPSSPFVSEGEVIPSYRRTSVLTTSSGDSAVSMEEGQAQTGAVSQEQIFESIRLHKEFISVVKQEHLTMRKKIKLVRQAKSYIKSNEGQLQERLAQSKNTRDMMAKCNILLAAKWQHMKREAANLSNIMIPWELRIKEIESHFGSVVASYFTFLRWLFWVNLVISFILVVFVIVPEMLTADVELAGERKVIYDQDKNSSTNLLILWEFEGVFKCSPIFYGYYTNVDSGDYRLPLAYFMTGLAVYVYSFVATLKKMAENSRMSKLSEKEDECIFSWKLFTGWDFMIGNAETAHNRSASIILSFKEALLEEEEKKKDPRNWRIISLRVLVNVCVVILLAVSAFAVVKVVERSNEKSNHWWRQNEITIVMSMISNMFPIFFEILGMLEHYHPRKQLRIQLGRIMLLNLLNIYSLIFALFSKIDGMTTQLENLKPKANASFVNETQHINFNLDMNNLLTSLYENETHTCYGTLTECKKCEFAFKTNPTPNTKRTITYDHPDISPAAFRKRSLTGTTINIKASSPSYLQRKKFPEYSKTSTLSYIEYDKKTTRSLGTSQGPLEEPHFTDISSNITSAEDFYNSSSQKSTGTNSILPDPKFVISTTTSKLDLKNFKAFISSIVRNTTQSDIDENSDETDDDDDDDYNYLDKAVTIETEAGVNITKPSINNFNGEYNSSFDITSVTDNYDNKGQNKNTIAYGSSSTTIVTTTVIDSEIHDESDFMTEMSTRYDSDEFTTASTDSINNVNETEILENKTGDTSEGSTIITEQESTKTVNKITVNRAGTTPSNSVTPILNGTATNKQNENYSTDSETTTSPTKTSNATNEGADTFNISKPTPSIDLDIQIVTESETSPCYKLKCIKKMSDSQHNNDTNSTVSTNYSRDFIIEDHHNHQRYNLSMRTKRQLLTLCWETMFGQELVKLTMMDMVLCILGTLFVDFYRAVFVRYMNRCWCWDLEKKFPQYGDFKIAENILHLVNNQGMVWMGLFFSPGLAVLNLVKLVIMMYLRSWAVMTCNVPHEVVFRASRSNNFYLGLLLIMLFLCVLPVGYAIVWVRPSWHCGPFSDYDRIYHIFTSNLNKILPNKLKKISDYIASPGIVIPLLVLLILVIYYLMSLTNSLREANNDLKGQLRRERTEERRKMFQLADRRRRVGSAEMECTPFEKWKKILPNLPPAKSIDSDERRESADGDYKIPIKKKGDIFAKIVSMALRRPVPEEKITEVKTLDTPTADDETDTEFHESLPDDVLRSKNIKIVPNVEPVKKRANVEFVTTNEGKIKEDIVNPILKHKIKTLLSKKTDTSSLIQQTNIGVSEKSHTDIKQRATAKTRDLIKAKIIAESKKRADQDKNKEASSTWETSQEEHISKMTDKKIKLKQASESSTQSRQSDSIGSVIPVITISKTESDDDMLRDDGSFGVMREAEVTLHRAPSHRFKEVQPEPMAGPSKTLMRSASNLKSLRRQSSVDSIKEQKGSKDKRVDEGHKFQYSL